MAQTAPAGGEAAPTLRVAFATREEFEEVYAQDVAFGALFLPGEVERRPGERVLLRLAFGFCDAEVELDGDVAALVPAKLAEAGVSAGAAIQLLPPGDELRRRLEAATGLSLPPVDALCSDPRRSAPRFAARTEVVLEVANRAFPAETLDVSYNGMLVLLCGLDLSVGTDLVACLVHPKSREEIRLEARVMNQTPCDHGVMAVGLQFLYAMDRVDEVMAFVDDLQGFHHARKLATVAGSLQETPLEAVLETFSALASAGTLELHRGDDEGRIAYADGQIVYATTGLVSGTKALGRMFTWTDARFEFQPGVRPIDAPESPMPLESALFAAAVQRDDFSMLSLGQLSPETCFEIDDERCALAKAELGPLEAAIADNAGAGFPLGALLDILPESDVAIYKALCKLLGDGVLAVADS